MAHYTCFVCKKEFYRTGRRIAVNCSRTCKAKWITITQTGKKQKRTGVYKKCEVCGKERYVSPGKIPSLGRVYCSMKCRNKDKTFWDNVRGENSWSWKGGKYVLGGYVYVKSHDHPFRNSSNYVAEHRLIMEKHLGRYLIPNEEVHHKNQNKKDNRIENLEIVIKKAHWGEIKCPHCQKKIKLK